MSIAKRHNGITVIAAEGCSGAPIAAEASMNVAM